MNEGDLRAAARRIGEAVGHTYRMREMQPDPDAGCLPLCSGCLAERASLAELEAAVAEEREACALIAVEKWWLGGELANRRMAKVAHKLSAEIANAIRARGGK